MLANRALEEKTKALEKAQPPGVVIDATATKGDELEVLDPEPPEHPSALR